MIRKYRPSNGTEGCSFRNAWCEVCEHDRKFREEESEPCEILGLTFIYDAEDEKYPEQWIYDETGKPKCTAFVNEGDEIPYKCIKTLDLFG